MNNEILHNHKRMRSTHPMQKKEVVSLLLKLSRQGRASELRELIKEYEDVIKYIINKTDNGKLAALHYAARNEAFDCVRILVEEGGADVNMKTCEQFTPLHFAARYRRQTGKPTTEFIGATPARQNPRPSVDSEIGGPLSTKVPENTDHELSCAVKETETVLPDEVIHYLVDHGAQLNGQDANGWTALHYAAIRGNEVATHQLLKEPGIDFELADHDGMRPLHLAVAHNETEIVRCLLSAKADPFAVSHRGNLPIHFACTTCNVDLVKLLLSYCGNEEDCQTVLNAPNRDGETPLHWSVVKGHEKVVQLCLKKKADPNLTAFTGETSLHMAARVGSVEIARVLIQEGVCLDSEDVMLQTALHKAAERNNLDVVNLLLEK